MIEEPVLRVRIEAATLSALRAFIDEVDADAGCRAVARTTAAGYGLDVFLPQGRLDAARSDAAAVDVALSVLENQSEISQQRQAEVGAGNRFAARGETPRGLGRKE